MSERPVSKTGRSAGGANLRPKLRPTGWSDEEDEAADAGFHVLSRDEAAQLQASNPPVSPWRVVAVQAAVGVVLALIGWLVVGSSEVAWSLLYGAATVVVPGALLARGMTGRPAGMSSASHAVSFMSWELVKIGFSVAMLLLAPKVVQPLSWPALLVALVLCIQVYWFALLWRGRKQKS